MVAIDKQRRLCTTAEHATCATFGAAVARTGAEASGTATATRWALTRTTPAVLDHGTLPLAVGALGRDRRTNQVALGGLMVVALLAVLVARFPIAGGAGVPAANATPTPTPAASVDTLASIPPSAEPSTAPSPSPTPSPSAPATPGVTPPATQPTSTASPSSAPAPTGSTYRVRAGDTLYGIAARFGTTVAAIQAANGLSDARLIHIGQVLVIPPPA